MLDDAVEYLFFDSFIGDPEEDIGEFLRDGFHLSYLLGSETQEDHPLYLRKAPNAFHVAFNELEAFMALPQHSGDLEILEIFGGEAGTSKVALRRRLRTGKNVDVVTGTDLTVPDNVRQLEAYISRHKPLIVIGGPPCSSFASWSRYNRVHHPETFQKTRGIGIKLARVFASIARTQILEGRFFLLEHPAGSELFQLPEYQAL